MKKANSIIKDDSNLRKSRFGCNFHHSLINFKKHQFFFGTYGLWFGTYESGSSGKELLELRKQLQVDSMLHKESMLEAEVI